VAADGWMRMGSSSQGPIYRIKPVSLDLCYPIISVTIPPIEDDILDVYPTTADTTSPQAALFFV